MGCSGGYHEPERGIEQESWLFLLAYTVCFVKKALSFNEFILQLWLENGYKQENKTKMKQ